MRVEPIPTTALNQNLTVFEDKEPLTGTEPQLHGTTTEVPVPNMHKAEDGSADSLANGDARRQIAYTPDGRRQLVRIVDAHSGEVLCQVPSEQVLNVGEQIDAELKEIAPDLDVRS